jgi:hypothetical protein
LASRRIGGQTKERGRMETLKMGSEIRLKSRKGNTEKIADGGQRLASVDEQIRRIKTYVTILHRLLERDYSGILKFIGKRRRRMVETLELDRDREQRIESTSVMDTAVGKRTLLRVWWRRTSLSVRILNPIVYLA